MDLNITAHANIRIQQRGIPFGVIHHLYRFGEMKSSNGAVSVFLTRKSLDDAARELSRQDLQTLHRHRNSYLIVGDDGRIVTVARSLRKFRIRP